MFKEKTLRYILVFYTIVLFFIIGLIINKFTVRKPEIVTPVSFGFQVSEKVSAEKLVSQLYDWMEITSDRSQSIIAEGIPAMKKGDKAQSGLLGQLIQPKKWMQLVLNWVLGVDVKRPHTYLTSSIPHLENYEAQQALAPQDGNEIYANRESLAARQQKVIKSERGSIYLNIPKDELRTELPKPTNNQKPLPAIIPNQPEIEIAQRKPRIMVYHTHGSETFFDDTNPQDNRYHTLLPHMGKIVDVGKALAENLDRAGISVYHDTSSYDGKVFADSYNQARQALRQQLSRESFDILLDIHRDAYEKTDFSREDFIVEVNGKPAAKVMLVITQGYLNYSSTSWSVNKKLCIALAGKLQEKYPGLLRKILPVEGRRYNQDLHPQSLLIEVGYQYNTTEEAVYTGELLARALAELLEDQPVFLLDKRLVE